MSTIFKKNHGFTLVELMLSMTLGLVIVLAATQLFVTNQQSFALQRGLGDINENSRLGTGFIMRSVQGAQYIPAIMDTQYRTRWTGIVTNTTELPTATAAQITGDGLSAVGIATNSDQLVVQRYADNQARDCEGNNVAGGRYIVERFFLRADPLTGVASALACDAGSHDGGTLTNYGDNGVILLPAVDNFQILLGVATVGATNAAVVQRYVTPTQYAALGNPQILAVKMALMITSLDQTGGLGQPAVPQPVAVLNQNITPPRDSRIRRVYENTVLLRNVAQFCDPADASQIC
ncbi:PilW family protein [Agitococcus lubricus]|uniref:Type IV pilus assembly protein PilW n=1 Tax=Agitococcus lubricus TaxID=1077255 RepID=A0A2T5J2D4_9GAMM|nr:PilW family protein [Agitococcus lubricus]PTQ90679.1 type IV pilus assembly protein PilW [Agitococcus lubricus]